MRPISVGSEKEEEEEEVRSVQKLSSSGHSTRGISSINNGGNSQVNLVSKKKRRTRKVKSTPPAPFPPRYARLPRGGHRRPCNGVLPILRRIPGREREEKVTLVVLPSGPEHLDRGFGFISTRPEGVGGGGGVLARRQLCLLFKL